MVSNLFVNKKNITCIFFILIKKILLASVLNFFYINKKNIYCLNNSDFSLQKEAYRKISNTCLLYLMGHP